MIPTSEFKQQRGGLWTAVFPCNQTDLLHRGTLEGVLRDTIQHEAEVHSASFDAPGFRNVMRAMTAGDVEILFLAAAWDLCKPKIVGAMTNFRSLFLQREGRDIAVKDGIYSEDVCLMPQKLRELVAEKPAYGRFPKEGLGSHFIRACIQHFAENGLNGGIRPVGQRFEFLPDNRNIITIQEKLGAILGNGQNSGLWRLGETTDIIRDKWPLPVELLTVPSADGGVDPNNFLMRWSDRDGSQKIQAGFTRGISTFKGTSVTQGQIVSNGDLPEPPVVECVLASMLKAANEEIQERRWGRVDNQSLRISSQPAPVIGDVQQIFGCLPEAKNDELVASSTSAAERVFGVKPPPMHIHALNEPEIVAGLQSLGIEKRILGHSPSQTASLNLLKASETKYPVRPLKLIVSDAVNDPIFSLVI